MAAQGAPVVPAGYSVTLLTTGLNFPKGITSALFRQGAGNFDDWLYVAESGANRIVRVSKAGGASVPFATSTFFPVGVNFYGGPFGEYLYIGNAFGAGITRADPNGAVTPFSLASHPVAGMDFGRGQYGNDLYIGEWPSGLIWRVTRDGTPVLFSTVPGTETRYIKFSQGDAFGTYLYFTDIKAARIYRVLPNGMATVFTQLAAPCIQLEGFEFSPGGVFGHYLYVGDLCTGTIYRVAPDGSYIAWATGFEGVSDIHFQPGKAGGFTMYLTDTGFGVPGAGKVYAIAKAK